MNWINVFGFIIIVFMLIPNIIYAHKVKGIENRCTNKVINMIEQIGRYGSMFFMVFNIGLLEFGFKSSSDFSIWIVLTIGLILLYWLFWFVYFKNSKMYYAIILALIPAIIFIFNGYILRHYFLMIFGFIFGISHLYITYVNN